MTTPQLDKDINPGPNDSSPRFPTAVGDTLFFSATDGSSGYELWKTDGTTAGTVRVADIRPGSGSSYPGFSTAVGDTLFFPANDGSSGTELWKTDGTTTTRVADIRPGSGSSYPRYLTAVGDTLFFSANDGSSGYELWSLRLSPDSPVLALEADTGSSDTDRITSNNTILVSGLEEGATWEYSTDQGTSWIAGTGTSFSLADGSYATGQVQARQTSRSTGFTSDPNTSFAAFTIDTTPVGPNPNRLVATRQQDLLIGTAAADLFIFRKRTFSQLSRYDTLQNFSSDDSIRSPFSRRKNYTAPDPITNFSARIDSLSKPALRQILKPNLGYTRFGAPAFKVRGEEGVFLAINNRRNGVQAKTDLLLFFDDYNLNINNPINIV